MNIFRSAGIALATLVGLFALLATAPVLGQSGQSAGQAAGANSTADAEVVEEIVVTAVSRRGEGVDEVNAAVVVLGAEELELVNHSHYQEALNRLPGVNVHRNNGQESLAAIRSPVLTGAGACGSFLVAENGIPVRSHGFCNVNEMFDAHSENAERIEVIRGPGSAFWGSNAVHGVINVVLPRPGEAGSLTLESGPRGPWRAQGRIGGGASGAANSSRAEQRGFRQMLLFNGSNEEGWRDDSGFAQQKLSYLYEYGGYGSGHGNGGLHLTGGFTLNNLNQETAGYVVGTDAYRDDDLRDSNPDPEAYRDSFSSRLWTSFVFGDHGGDHGSNKWQYRITPYFREVNMNFLQHFLPGQPVEDSEHRSFGAQTAAYRTLENGAGLALGFDAEATTGKLKQFQPLPTRGSAFLRGTIPQGQHYDYQVDAMQTAAFVSYQQALGARWQLSLGLRLEHINYDYDNRMLDGRTDDSGTPCGFGGCRYSRPADRDDSFFDLSPKLGLRYALNDNNKLELRVQRGFRAPQATELYRLQNAQSVAELDSVELDSYELSLSGSGNSWSGSWNYGLSLYLMDKANEIITNSARENLNGNHTAHRGLEATLGIDLSPSLSLHGAFNLAKHSYENRRLSGGMDIKGNEVDSAPDMFGNMRLQWQPHNRLLTELEWVHMGEYYTNPENTAAYPGHDVLNLRANYHISDAFGLTLNLLNISDEKYAERADWTTFSGDRYFPGEPPRAHLALTWNWQ